MLEPAKINQLFRYKAEQVSAIVTEAPTVADAIGYSVGICNQKEACTLLPSGCEHDLSESAQAFCQGKPSKLVAAPGLLGHHWRMLEEACGRAGIGAIQNGLRDHLGGIDIGITWAQYGIAETGTLVIDSSEEDLRLATMVSEIHIAFLAAADIYESAADLTRQMDAVMKKEGNYLAMITGASRTADIERVLALGVHGPLELHIVLIKECHG